MTAFNCVRASCTAAASAAALRVYGQFRPPGSPARLNGNGISIDTSLPPYCRRDTTPTPDRCEPSPDYDLCSSEEPIRPLGQHNFGTRGASMTDRGLSLRRTGAAASGLSYPGPATHTSTRADAVRQPRRTARRWLVREGVAARGAEPGHGGACIIWLHARPLARPAPGRGPPVFTIPS